jgi:2-oxo-4-hydroxy-4-carboxy-5-ureidoimidazoline decarboxylase
MIRTVNELSETQFLAMFGFLFEHSPWIVQQAAMSRPFRDVDHFHRALVAIVEQADFQQQQALLRSHPKLADKVAIARGLTPESTAEQASAGLDQLSEAEYKQFHELNESYSQKFLFPFIICVRLTNKAGILSAMARRLKNDEMIEHRTALDEVYKIVRLRLNDKMQSITPVP